MSLTPADVHAKKAEITAEGGMFEMEPVTIDGHEYRAYKQVTRRSNLAWRLRTIYNDGDSQILYGLGGLNDLVGVVVAAERDETDHHEDDPNAGDRRHSPINPMHLFDPIV